jgi:hypothetical protein
MYRRKLTASFRNCSSDLQIFGQAAIISASIRQVVVLLIP